MARGPTGGVGATPLRAISAATARASTVLLGFAVPALVLARGLLA